MSCPLRFMCRNRIAKYNSIFIYFCLEKKKKVNLSNGSELSFVVRLDNWTMNSMEFIWIHRLILSQSPISDECSIWSLFVVFALNHRNCVCVLSFFFFCFLYTKYSKYAKKKNALKLEVQWTNGSSLETGIRENESNSNRGCSSSGSSSGRTKKKTKYSQIAFCNLYFVVSRCYIFILILTIFIHTHTHKHTESYSYSQSYSHISWMANSYF